MHGLLARIHENNKIFEYIMEAFNEQENDH